MDLSDDATRKEWAEHLGGLFRDRLVVCGIAPLAGYTDLVGLLEQSSARRPLLVANAVGAGPVPTPAQAEVVHLNGAMELAPYLGLARVIVDLVQTGSTLKANGLIETEVIAKVTSRLIVNRTALKTMPEVIGGWIARFRAALAP